MLVTLKAIIFMVKEITTGKMEHPLKEFGKMIKDGVVLKKTVAPIFYIEMGILHKVKKVLIGVWLQALQ